MTNSELLEINRLIEELDAMIPSIEDEVEIERIIYRTVEDEQLMTDVISEVDEFEGEWQALEPIPFGVGNLCPLVAVDCGIIRLGETENGLVIALRASIIQQIDNTYKLKLYRTGPIYIRNIDKLRIMHMLGSQLGCESFYVETNDEGEPIRLKIGYADDTHQFGDRFRNWFERKIQLIAASEINDGIILLDGALTLRTRDTPAGFIQRIASQASRKNNALVGISKQSRLQVYGRPFHFLLTPYPNRTCYCRLSEIIRRESEQGHSRAERTLGNMYACRFSPVGGTFRVDVVPIPGQTDEEVLNTLYSSSIMKAGYPDILVQAHVFSYFTPSDAVQLQAMCGARYVFRPEQEQNITAIFAPFGGRFK